MPAVRDVGDAALVVELNLHVAGRVHSFDVLERRAAGSHREERENMIQALRVGLGRHFAGGENRFDLRAEIDNVAPAGPVQRCDADAVAGQDQRAAFDVVQREGVLPVEMVEHRLAVLFPHVDEHLGVGVGRELVPFRLEYFAAFGVVEDFAVEDDDDALVFVENRLLPIRQPNDRQPP